MTMSIKTYREVASVLKDHYISNLEEDEKTIRLIAIDLANMFYRDNSNFDYDKFYQAIGIE